ncbi:hypothetical protein HZS_4075 [Henneguya salminicola]|nr:hypothetical protein HZS_4075 [Henneguya salminicola]
MESEMSIIKKNSQEYQKQLYICGKNIKLKEKCIEKISEQFKYKCNKLGINVADINEKYDLLSCVETLKFKLSEIFYSFKSIETPVAFYISFVKTFYHNELDPLIPKVSEIVRFTTSVTERIESENS